MKWKLRGIAVTTALALLCAVAPIAAAQSNAPAPPPAINPANFVPQVTNKFFPLRPGTTFVYIGETDGQPTRDVMEVTHATKQVMGVTCTVVRDRAYEAGVLVEDTFDWYAQDLDGNVW